MRPVDEPATESSGAMSNGPAEPAKGMPGCLIAAIVVGALGVVAAVAVVIAVTLLARSAPGSGVLQSVGAAATSMTGPTVDAMRAIGCETPTSLDLGPMAHVVRSLAKDDDTQKQAARIDGMFAATCYSDSLTCAQVFAAWNRAAPAGATHVSVTVFARDRTKERCAQHFDRSGRELPPVKTDAPVTTTTTQ